MLVTVQSKMHCVILALSLVFLSASSERINVTNEYDLENFLCNEIHSLNSDTLLVLSDSITHLISNNVSFCVINTTYSLTLTSESSKQALIKCNDSSKPPNSGFAFINVHNVTLTRLVFTGCGEQLKRLAVMESINSSVSPMYFSRYHSAVLLFLHINVLLIDEVDITEYYGFAVLAINPLSASIRNITVTFGGRGDTNFGSGVFMLFTDMIGVPSHDNYNVTIQQSRWSNNPDSYHSKTNSICDSYHLKNQKPIPIYNAAGLSIFHLQKKFTAHTQVMQSNFTSNYGILAGAVLVMYYNSVNQSQVAISNATFKLNFSKSKCPGSDLLFIFYASKMQPNSHNLFPLYVSNSDFSDHNQKDRKSIIFLYIYYPLKDKSMTLTFSRAKFKSVRTSGTGSCLHAVSDISDFINNGVQIILRDITATRNIQFTNLFFGRVHFNSIFAIENLDYIFLNGNSSYTNNYGSVFGISNTKVILGGQLHFENNTGNNGAAFLLTGSSRFILQDGLNATFIHNVAFTTGGAIYAYNSITSECMFTPNGSNVMLFIDNSAAYSGNSIFSNNLYNCSTIEKFDPKVAKKLYFKLSKGCLFNSKEKQLSTVAFKQEICHHDSSHFKNKGIIVYPGMMLHFPMVVLDVFNQSTRSDVSLNIVYKDYKLSTKIPSENWYIAPKSVTLPGNNCTVVNVTILKRTENDVQIWWLNLLLSASQISKTLSIYINPTKCPIGFNLHESTHKCECSRVLRKIDHHPVCMISSDGYSPLITITLASRSISNWIGTVNNGTVFGVSSDCYIFCRYKNDYNTFVINDSPVNKIILIADSSNFGTKESLCLDNREGPLCSQCIPGYSVTFGSNQCAKCSNWWLLTLIVYGLAGPLLIYLLYTLKLTLTTGKLNGIIFYSQIMNINMPTRYRAAIGYKFADTFRSIVTGILFLLSLNIDFNIPLCFYDGMTELWKTGLGLLFPVYLLSIVIGLIVISRYSVRLSNRIASSSVQVLVTVVHLSFSTLLTSLFDVFIPVYIYTNTSDVPLVVWQNDGTVEYGKGSHLILMIVTGLIVGPILTAYLTVLLAGRPLMKINRVREYLRPIYEAIHAPYKQNKEFLFSFSTIFIALTFLLSTLFIGANQTLGLAIGIPAICLYLNMTGFFHPFKRTSLNVLNTFIYSIIIILSCSIWSIVGSASSVEWAILVTLCHLTVLIILICVIISQFSFGKRLFNKINAFYINIFKADHPHVQQRNLNEYDSFYQSCREREPLLNY